MSKIKIEITRLRKRDGLTQQQLAEKLGVSHQTISKWENGTSLPDIAMLPSLSSCFHVTVDEILGLKPLESDPYQSKGTSESEYWNDKMDYLQQSRALMWNDDYLKFLVQSVWKLNQPVNIIDFGCGYGYLGTKIMPLLPVGSTYTGIDVNQKLIEEAESLFKTLDFKSQFIVSDLNAYRPQKTYDLVICQAFLRHVPNAYKLLSKMVDSAKDGGLVVCIEVDRSIEQCGMFIKGMDFREFGQLSTFEKIWRREYETEGRDYKLGMKLPVYMKELGLRDIETRLNDKVNYLHNDGNDSEKSLRTLLKTIGMTHKKSPDELEKMTRFLMNRGIDRAEAELYLKADETTYAHIAMEMESLELVHLFGLLVSYGWK